MAKNNGFSIPEITLAVVLIAALTTFAFGDISSMLNLNKQKLEEVNLKEIKKAMESYMEDRGQLPPQDTAGGPPFWYDLLVPYTDLSADQIQFDPWFGVRQYKRFSINQTFRDADFETFYGVLVSYGEDGLLDTPNFLGALDDADLDQSLPLVDFPGPAPADDLAIYQAIEPSEGDDQLFKLSDYKTKMANYEVTAKRLGAITSALQNYAQSMQNFAISAREANWANKIFYPPADYDDSAIADPATYGAEVVIDTGNFVIDPSGLIQGLDGDDTVRRPSMMRLMRLLGLPDSHCCSAMTVSAADGLPEPFYYSSNPLRKTGGGCAAARASDPQVEIVLTPRLVVGVPDAGDCM